MKHVILKVGLQGEVYWDGQWLNHAAFKKALSQLKTEDGYLTYYREAPDEEPSKAVLQTFEAIMASQNKIQLGHKAASEWGRLAWIEVEEAPDRFHFSLTRIGPVLFGPVLNVLSFYRGCGALGMRMLGPPPWRNLPQEEALRRAKLYGPPSEEVQRRAKMDESPPEDE